MAFSPDGKLVGLGGHFWEIETGEPLMLPASGVDEADAAISLAFAPDGQTVALGLPGGRVRLCDLANSICNQTLVADFPGDVVSLAASPDGAQLAAAYAYTLETYPSPAAQVWQMPAGVPLHPLAAPNIAYVTYSPGGELLATLTVLAETYQRNFPYGVIQLWSSTGEQLAALPPTDVVRLAFSPDGHILAAGLSEGQVQLWSLDGTHPGMIPSSGVTPLVFTLTVGLIIASATGVIEVWGR
jgi:WD40 repeat protein